MKNLLLDKFLKMKKLLSALFLAVFLNSFSQEIYTSSGNGNVYDSKKNKIAPEVFKQLLQSNQPALDLYNADRTKKTVGNLLLYGGFATAIGNLLYQANKAIEPYGAYNNSKSESTPNVLFFVAGAMVLIAIPVKIGFSNKVKKSVEMYNNYSQKTKVSFIQTTSILANRNGIGLALTF